MTDLEPNEIYKYACEDADITFRLKSIIEKEIKDLKLSKLLDNVETTYYLFCQNIENNGVKIDTQFLSKMSKELRS